MRQNFRGIVVGAMNPKTVKVRTMIQVRHPKVLKVRPFIFFTSSFGGLDL